MALSFRLNENTGHGGDRLHLIILPKLAKHGAGAPPDFQHTRLSMARQSTRAAQILHRDIDRQRYGSATRFNAVNLLNGCLFACQLQNRGDFQKAGEAAAMQSG